MKYFAKIQVWTLACMLGLGLLAGCAGPTPADYANQTPKFDLKQYFNGKVDAVGMVQDRSGKVIKRFSVLLDCKWDGNNGTLNEYFEYSDGTKQTRVWHIVKDGDHYVGTAADVVGKALGEASGNALHWSYTLALPVDDSVYNIQFNDWMFQMDDKTMLNRAVMSKFGFKVGEIFLSFHKRD